MYPAADFAREFARSVLHSMQPWDVQQCCSRLGVLRSSKHWGHSVHWSDTL